MQVSTGNTGPFGNTVIFGNASAVTPPGPHATDPGIEAALNSIALAATNNNTTINVLVESNKQMAALLAALSAKMDNVGTTRVQPAPGIVATPRTALTKIATIQWGTAGHMDTWYIGVTPVLLARTIRRSTKIEPHMPI